MQYGLRSKIVTVVVISVAFCGVFYSGYKTGVKKAPEIYKTAGLSGKEEGKPDEVDFSAFWKAWNIINDKYVPANISSSTVKDKNSDSVSLLSVTNQDKVWGSIVGMTASLGDPYTVFFPPEEDEAFQSEISGTFQGVGMEIGIKDGILTVIAPLKNTPAEKAGILSGDKILKIDDTSTEGMSTDAAVRKIRGTKGTAVQLMILRAGKKEPFPLRVVRDTINIPTIDTEVRLPNGEKAGDQATGLQGNGTFVIKLYSFSGQSTELFRGALREFVLSGSDKLIIDLRSNPGGYLDAAVNIASWFLPGGRIVVQEEYAQNDVRVHRSQEGYDIFNDKLKLAILVNNGSASASEILAGALQEYGVAKLVGTKTFGKGSVQELVDITPDTSLKVTVARWLTPRGRSISNEGLIPDYEVETTAEDLEKGKDPQMQKAVDILLGR